MKKILLLIALLSGWNVYGQNAFTIFNTTNSPLPENSVRAIAFDQNDVKWVGTDYGLAAYDNTNWTIYQTFNSDLPDNSVRSIAVDKQNNKWIGTFNAGLAKFDGTTWTIYDMSNSNIPDNFVRSLAVDTLGNLWVGTIGGLGYFDGTNWTIYNTSNSSFLISNNIGAIYVNPETNNVAIGTINGGMALYNGSTWSHFTIWNSNLPDNTILGLDKDSLDLLWMSTPASGVSAYLGGVLFSTYNTISSTINTNSLTCIKIAQDQSIYVGSNDSGLTKKNNLDFISYNTTNSPMPDNFVQTVNVDAAGIVWVGTQIGGLIRIDAPLLSSVPESSTLSYNLFPVPTTDHLNVLTQSELRNEITVMDVQGRVMNIPFSMMDKNRMTLNTSTLVAGIYFVKMYGKDGSVATGKFQVVN